MRSKNVNVNILFQIQAQIIFSQTTFRRIMKWNWDALDLDLSVSYTRAQKSQLHVHYCWIWDGYDCGMIAIFTCDITAIDRWYWSIQSIKKLKWRSGRLFYSYPLYKNTTVKTALRCLQKMPNQLWWALIWFSQVKFIVWMLNSNFKIMYYLM